MKATSPDLNRPLRSEAEAERDHFRADRDSWKRLAELANTRAYKLQEINADLLVALDLANKFLWELGYTTTQPEVAAIEAVCRKARGE